MNLRINCYRLSLYIDRLWIHSLSLYIDRLWIHSLCISSDRLWIHSLSLYIDRLWIALFTLWRVCAQHSHPARTTRPISARVTRYMAQLLRRMLARASVIGRMHFGANEYAVSLEHWNSKLISGIGLRFEWQKFLQQNPKTDCVNKVRSLVRFRNGQWYVQIGNLRNLDKNDTYRSADLRSADLSEWVSSFLTAHQHKIGHSVP